MKKFLLTLLAAFAVNGAWAQTTADVSSYDDAMYAVGQTYLSTSTTIDLAINFKNSDNMSASDVVVTLPEGLSFIADEEAIDDVTPLGTSETHELMGKISSATEAQIILFSGKQAPIGENAFVLTLAVDNSVIVADKEYPIIVSAQSFANGDGKEVKLGDVQIESTIVFSSTLVFDESKPVPGYADKAKANVKIIRTLKKDTWSTIVLPCPMSNAEYTAAFGTGVTLATYSGLNVTFAEDGVTPTEINLQFTKRTGAIVAGTPYLIKSTQDTQTYEIELASKTLRNVVNPVSITCSIEDEETGESLDIPSTFNGSYEGTVVPENGLFLSENKFWYSTGNTDISGLRGWFIVDAKLGEAMAAGVKVNLNIDGETTGLDGVSLQRVVEGVYDLSGRKIQLENRDLNTLPKGVYIIDGKKVAIK